MLKQIVAQTVRMCADLVAPPYCAHCKIFLRSRTIFCAHCASLIEPVVSVTLPLSARYTIKVVAASAYKDPIKQLILAKGHSDVLAGTTLGSIIWDMSYARYLPMDYLIPIPLHWTRRAWRGFNQTEEMAKAIAKKSGKPVAHLLTRVKRTHFQSELAAPERAGNVAQAFALTAHDMSIYQGKHLVLVDDLMTTGSTLQSAARELIALKPASIAALVACRVI